MNHRGQVQQHGSAVKDTHHVGRIRLLQTAGLEQLIQHGVWIGVVFDFNHDTDALFGGLVAYVADTDDNFLVHQIRNLDEHVGFLDLVGNFVNHDALAFVVVEHLALGANVEAAFPCGVHVGDAVNPVDGRPGGKVRAFDVLHVFFYRDGWLLVGPAFENGVNVKVHCPGYFREVVGWDSCGHTDRNTVASVEEQIGQSSGQNRGFIF